MLAKANIKNEDSSPGLKDFMKNQKNILKPWNHMVFSMVKLLDIILEKIYKELSMLRS